MCHSRVLLLMAFCFVAGACSTSPAEEPPPARDASTPAKPLYHPDPQHLWNRVHEALLARVGPDGRIYGHDRLEPLLWPETKYLLEDRSEDRALAVLEEFIKNKGEKLIEDPLKRAVLQRDLWLVFNWLGDGHSGFVPQGTPVEKRREVQQRLRESQQRLRRPLAAVIGRLALTPDQIKHLPDNYAAAVASGEFAKRYDAKQPDRPYLPPDLFAADGPWVCVGRPDGPVAPEHMSEERSNAFTNSAFLVFLRLPAGRAATLDYLKRLRAFDQPLLVRAEDGRREKYLPNPKLPQFPVGAELVLVRRALVVASPPTLMPTTLTESVQLRIHREIPDMTGQTLDAALGGGAAAGQRAQSWQSFYEFRLSRSLLFAGRGGGLHALGADERDFKTGFGAHGWDEFETEQAGRSFPESRQHAIRQICFACHSLPGVYSFNSFFNFRSSNMRDGDSRRPASLTEMSHAEVGRSAAKGKQESPNWTALRDLLAK